MNISIMAIQMYVTLSVIRVAVSLFISLLISNAL